MKPNLRGRVPSAVAALVLVVALGWVLPGGGRQPFVETLTWSLLVVTAFAGWGWGVARLVAPKERVDLGLLVAWGASAMCFVGGVLIVPSLMTRTAALALVEVGVALAVGGLLLEAGSVQFRARAIVRFVRREPQLALVGALVVFTVAIQYAMGVAEWHTNPYDDDIAYLPFAKRLLDTGSFPEPFSFRRLSAMGGQTFFVALVGVRAAMKQAHTFDRSVALLMTVLLIVGHRRRGGRPSFLFRVLAIILFLTLPSIAINTASYYSGVAFFLALFRTLVWLGERERASWKNALPLALVGAAACTLRQNFLPVPAVTLGASYVFRLVALKGRPLRERISEPLLAAAMSLVALVPWMIASYQSNRTFLYPVMSGTFNRGLALDAAGMTLGREIYMQVWVALEGLPLHVLGAYLLASAFVVERASRRPLWSFILGCAAGFVLLVHGLTQSDAGNIGRYAYGFMMAFVLAAMLETGSVRITTARLGRPQIAAGIALVATFIQLVESRIQLNLAYVRGFHNIELASAQPPRSPRAEPPEVHVYAELQRTIPAGERLAVLLDEPYHLNFSRNPIYNFDMPGYSSLPPGMPFFQGSEKLEAYIRGLGVRYFAFVKPDHSRYHYRREYWVEMVANEQEIWRAFAPYLLDFLDNEVAIAARHKHVFEDRGMVVVDLQEAP